MDTRKQKKPSVALVVGSGGLKPLGINLFFEFLDNHNLKPDAIFACSGGAILSSHWAQGYSAEQLSQFMHDFELYARENPILGDIDYRTLLGIGNYPGGRFTKSSALLSPKTLLQFLKNINGNKLLEECTIKTFLCATDLDTGEAVYLDKGKLSECVYASCALYPMLPPIKINNQWLVDGAYASAVPVFEAVKRGYDRVIALVFEDKEPSVYSSFFEFYFQFVGQLLNKNARKQNALAVHLHHDEVMFIRFFYDKCIKFHDLDSLNYVREVTRQTLERRKDDILKIFN